MAGAKVWTMSQLSVYARFFFLIGNRMETETIAREHHQTGTAPHRFDNDTQSFSPGVD